MVISQFKCLTKIHLEDKTDKVIETTVNKDTKTPRGTTGKSIFSGLLIFQSPLGLKVGFSPSKKSCFICFNESPLKMMKCFLFHLKSYFRSQDI